MLQFYEDLRLKDKKYAGNITVEEYPNLIEFVGLDEETTKH